MSRIHKIVGFGLVISTLILAILSIVTISNYKTQLSPVYVIFLTLMGFAALNVLIFSCIGFALILLYNYKEYEMIN